MWWTNGRTHRGMKKGPHSIPLCPSTWYGTKMCLEMKLPKCQKNCRANERTDGRTHRGMKKWPHSIPLCPLTWYWTKMCLELKLPKCKKKLSLFVTLWPWPLTYDLEKLIRSGHYPNKCVYQIWKESIQGFLSYRVNTITAGGGRRAAGDGRLRRKTIISPDPSDPGDIIIIIGF